MNPAPAIEATAGDRLERLQILRGVAVAMVVAFHATSNYLRADSALLAHGYSGLLASGVDIFFVISGFVIHYATRRAYGPDVTIDFLKKRVARIVPLYWLVTTLVIAIGLFAPSLLRSYVFSLDHAVASFAFIPWPRPDGGVFPPLVPGWSLNFEMMFYAIYAALMTTGRRDLALPLLALVFGAGFLAVHWLGLDPALFIFGNVIVFEFLAGVALADLWLARGGHFTRWTGAICLALALPLIACALVDNDLRWPAQIAGFGLLVAGVLTVGVRPWPAAGRLMTALGDASYSIYLIHPLALSALASLARLRGLSQLDLPEIVVMMAIAMASGWAFHHLVETPLLTLARNRMGIGQPRPATAMASAFVAPSPQG